MGNKQTTLYVSQIFVCITYFFSLVVAGRFSKKWCDLESSPKHANISTDFLSFTSFKMGFLSPTTTQIVTKKHS